MQQFPLFIRFENRPVLVVGGGVVAARKVRAILAAGASVHVIAPALCKPLQQQVDDGQLSHDARNFMAGDTAGYWLCIAATNHTAVNASVAAEASDNKVLVNVADAPHLGDVGFASVVNRLPLQIAISTSGHSPILARLIHARIAAFIPESYGALARLAGDYRQRIKDRFHSLDERRRFWERVLVGPIAQRLLGGDATGARLELETLLEANPSLDKSVEGSCKVFTDPQPGEVYLVGAGPGDPDLLTFRALRLMHQADVVLHDRLVSDQVLALCPDEAEYLYVGKRRANHAMEQTTINETLVNLAAAGKRVLRLKGGDPFIFGRGGEEIETLSEAGIRFEVVPGITAASGCSSYAGIPLTHRDHAQSCVFVTGHLKQGQLELNWQHLVQPNQTVVCYMGLTALSEFCAKLEQHGLPGKTPAALVERGTTPHQRVLTGTVATLAGIVSATPVRAPTLIIVGSVVTLQDRLQWFNPQPSRPA